MAEQIKDDNLERERQFHQDKRLKRYRSLHAASLVQTKDVKQEPNDYDRDELSDLGPSLPVSNVPLPSSRVQTPIVKDDVYGRPTRWPRKRRADSVIAERRNTVIPKSLRAAEIIASQSASKDTALSGQKPVAGKGFSKDLPQVSMVQLPAELAPPGWYSELRISRNDHCDRSKIAELISIRTMITKCQTAQPPADLERLHANLRDQLHRIEFISVDAILVKKSKLLDPNYGLPQIFHERFLHNTSYPFDVENDAKALFQKWRRADFDADLLRGIIINKKQKRTAARLDEHYPNRMSPNFIGAGDLLNGQWWPSQLCALRDGAHGSAQAGIHGHPKKGAFSVVIAGSHYDDKDDGDTILYCGTLGGAEGISSSTQRMQESLSLGNPIRVLRSHSLKSKYRPAEGLRFDGLYDVVTSELLDASKNHHRFTLKRRSGQGPIRYEEPFQKPTSQELEAYHRQRDLFMTA